MTETTSIHPTELPTTIRNFLAAHVARDAATAILAFSPDAVVTDEGRTYRGTQEVLEFLQHAGGEFTYTTELVGAERTDGERWVAINHLEGDFPGGVADLRFRFTMTDDRISELDIAP